LHAVGFCKRAADVVVVKFFIKFFTAKEYNRQTFDWINSMKFRVSLLAKHWTYQNLNECINAAVVILPFFLLKVMTVEISAESALRYSNNQRSNQYCMFGEESKTFRRHNT